MRRVIVFLVSSIAGLLLLAGVALAADVRCPGGLCFGTPGDDVITGTDRFDNIFARAGNDRVDAKQAGDSVNGESGNDRLFGDDATISVNSARTLRDGNDTISGAGGNDMLFGYGGSDVLFGGVGNDRINAQELSRNRGTDRVFAGAGDDRISARDSRRDTIDCGPGVDRVSFDPGLDVVVACEILNPPGGAAAVQAPGTGR